MILSFSTVKLRFQIPFVTNLLVKNLTNFVKPGTKVNQLISMRIHFLTLKSGPIESMNTLHLLKVFSLVRESLKAGISSFKILNFQIIICFDLVISCIKLKHRSRWSGLIQCIGKQGLKKIYMPCWVSINSSRH